MTIAPVIWYAAPVTAKQFYDWQTAGGTNDVMRLVDCLERADVARLVEVHPHLWESLPEELRTQIQRPASG
jgi:hypothetical protein